MLFAKFNAHSIPQAPLGLGFSDDESICRGMVHAANLVVQGREIPQSREEVMQWVSDTFEQAAQEAYGAIGRPPFSAMTSGWVIFAAMTPLIPVTTL